jgi:MtaA/CmuA family methyltransferase
MTRKEHYQELLRAGNPSARTFFRPILMHFAARFNDTTYGKFASDYKTLVESNIRAMEYFDTDMVSLISDPYRETSAFGSKIEYIDEGVPRCMNILVTTLDDVKNLPDPDVYRCERTLDRIKGAAYFQQLLKGMVPVSGWVEGPLAEACDLAGVNEMLVQLMIDPDFTNYILDKCLITGKSFAKAQVEAGCDLIGIGDAICSQIDRDNYDLYVRDRHAELIACIHECGASVKLHICGDTSHLLESYRELNADIIDLDWQVDMDQARNILGSQVVLGGNINPVLVQDKSAEEIFSLSRTLVDRYKDQKYLLAAGCEITVLTPPENLMAMRKASIRS